MAGLISKADIQEVREKTRIEEIVGQHVTLRPAGSGSLKGLCPFHDERSPSFNVRPQLGYWHCFGCNEGGDAISFVMKHDHLEFSEAVEYLASKCGVTLHYEAGGRATRDQPGRRSRLLEANALAESFYREQLNSSEAEHARGFLAGRKFTQDQWESFGVGYSPASWDSLTRHLRGRGFTDAELTTAGLSIQGNRGLYDRFRDRVMWPIRDLTGATVGFGARRLGEDPQSPKYLNTPETPVYHKSTVLYGLDLAKRDISKRRRVVIVEGYTDVMATHLSGETTAVATCGTAFASEHVSVIRRLLGDTADPAAGVVLTSGRARGGEVIFTFDGDEAGKAAARKVYAEDQKFATQTFVAIEKHGLDPCDLRIEQGDGAIRSLIESRIPLFEFVLRSVLKSLDLRTAEGRVAGLRSAIPVLSGIKDVALRNEYVRMVAGWLGMDVAEVRRAMQSGSRSVASRSAVVPEDPIAKAERQALVALLQRPLDMVGSGFEDLDSSAYMTPINRAVHEAIEAAGGLDSYLDFLAAAEGEVGVGPNSQVLATRRWVEDIRAGADPLVAEMLTEMAVEPLPYDDKDPRSYSLGVMRALVRMSLTRTIASLRRELRRLEPDDEAYESTFARIVELDARRRHFVEE
jgi:DNA primase, catalytic core